VTRAVKDIEIDINVSLVRQLIAEQFPQWANLPIKPVEFDGWDNRTFHLGDDMSVRLPSGKNYIEQVQKEQKWLPILAPHLPLPIPTPIAMGKPDNDYPWHWSIYGWLEGEHASYDSVNDLCQFATKLAQFLTALQQIDTTDGPPAGKHNFYRGGDLTTYDDGTRAAITALDGKIDTDSASKIWQEAISTSWHGAPIWVHGDVVATNLLVKDGCLSAVIDFGCSSIGDPACDMVIAWTFFSKQSREAFRSELNVDDDTWARGRGWALWKALILLAKQGNTTPLEAEKAQRTLDELLQDE